MGVHINFLRLTPEFTSTNQRQLVGNIFWKVTAQVYFEVYTAAKGITDEPIIFRDPAFVYTTIITDGSGSGKFRDFYAGDTFTIVSTGLNNGTSGTVIEKIDDNSIRTNVGLSFAEDENCTVHNTTPWNGYTFYSNLIGNSEQLNWDDKVTGEAHKWTVTHNLALATETMIPNDPKSWQLGTVTLEHTGTSGYYSEFFTLTHVFYIEPFFKPSLYNDLVSGVVPDWFLNDEALKYAFRIEARPNNNNPNRVQFLESQDELGDTGYYNENFNGKPNYYYVDSLIYERVSDSQILEAIQLSDSEDTQITIRVKNTENSPFQTGGNPSEVCINFIKLPSLDSEVSNTSTNKQQNFLFDRAFMEVGGPIVNGDQFGTGYQIFKTCSATLIGPDEIEITAIVDFGDTAYQNLSNSDIQRYLIAVSTADPDKDTPVSDGVTLLVDFRDFYTDLGIDNLITFDTKFIEHPYNDIADAVTDIDAFLEDEIVGYIQAEVDTSQAADTVSINSISCNVIARNTVTNESFILKTFTVSLANANNVNGLEYVNFQQDSGFKAPTSDLIRFIKVVRRVDLDAAPLYYYDIYFPFLVKWEYWQALASANNDFFDVNEPNDGLNNQWDRYDDVANWEIRIQPRFSVNVGTETGTVSSETQFPVSYYDDNDDWDQLIEVEDESGNPLIGYILGFEKTKVRAIFTWMGVGAAPALNEVDIIIRLEPNENGGEFVSTRISSAREKGSQSQFDSIDLSNKVVVTEPSPGVFHGEAFIDNNDLQDFSLFDITIRIYDKRLIIANGKEVSGGGTGDYKETSEGTGIKQISS